MMTPLSTVGGVPCATAMSESSLTQTGYELKEPEAVKLIREQQYQFRADGKKSALRVSVKVQRDFRNFRD